MLAIASRRPLGPDHLGAFRRLAVEGCVPAGSPPGHGDGWGVVVYRAGHPVYLGREPNDASEDPTYGEMLARFGELRPRGIVMAHLRKASIGAATRANTQPFTQGTWGFAHNGTIHGFTRPVGFKLEGDTDSERYFKALLEALDQGASVREAVEATTGWIRDHNRFTSLTFLLSDGLNLYGYREFAAHGEYYTLSYCRTGEAVILSQEPIVKGAWRPLGNRQLITVSPDLSISLGQL